MRLFAIAILSLSLYGCLGAPDGVQPVKDFAIQPYLGRWYEIARLDHSFERGLIEVTAEYSLREDGGIRVINSGRSAETGEPSRAEGRAYFVGSEDVGHLKVSFFGPFFGSYIVFELDAENYQYAFVAGNTTDYLWLLARTPQVSDQVMDRFLERASSLGFNTDNLILVPQS
ncbi:MAG: lipocalin family protein [Porticoccaceae bacterium]